MLEYQRQTTPLLCTISCPYCNVDKKLPLTKVMGQSNVYCNGCGKLYTVEAEVTVSTFGDCEINGARHYFNTIVYLDKTQEQANKCAVCGVIKKTNITE